MATGFIAGVGGKKQVPTPFRIPKDAFFIYNGDEGGITLVEAYSTGRELSGGSYPVYYDIYNNLDQNFYNIVGIRVRGTLSRTLGARSTVKFDVTNYSKLVVISYHVGSSGLIKFALSQNSPNVWNTREAEISFYAQFSSNTTDAEKKWYKREVDVSSLNGEYYFLIEGSISGGTGTPTYEAQPHIVCAYFEK